MPNSATFDYSGQASTAFEAYQVREIKRCETCGINFLRVPLSGLRDCAPCRELQEERREAMNNPLCIPSPNAAAERIGHKKRGRGKNGQFMKAQRARCVRVTVQ